MNGVVSDLRSKFENNLMYVINQKSSHFPNNLPNGAMFFPDSQIHPGIHVQGDQMPFSTCMPTMINNHNPMQANMTRFINPHNSNSLRRNSIMTPAMLPQVTKNQKTTMNNCSITDDISLSFQTTDNFCNMNASYKSRNPPIDLLQSIVKTQNNTNLSADLITSGNMVTDSNMKCIGTSNRPQTPRNKRTRSTMPQTPIIKDNLNDQATLTPTLRPTSTNINALSSVTSGPAHHKCLHPPPYNMVDMMPQQMRPRMQVNVLNPYGCNRSQSMEKNMSMYIPAPHPSPGFNPSSNNVSPFFNQVDSALPLPMFHLHSRLSKLPECDRLTFPVNHGNLWGPLTLRHGDQVTEVQFELNQENLQQIINRSDLDIVVTSFTHRDQFRLCHWPEFLELRINGKMLTLDCTLLQDLKVHMPCCIKQFCRLGMNTLQFIVTKCVCCHLFQTFMVHRPTLSHAMETIQSKCISAQSTKILFSEIYPRNTLTSTNPEDVNNICVISLICPMSQSKIAIPARTKYCKHIQPFDLLEFLKVQSKWPQYFCPICRVRVTFNLNEYIQNIIVDEIIKDIIAQTDHNVRRVIIYPDGKWKPINDLKPGCTLPNISQSFQDTFEQDLLIRQSPLSCKSTLSSPQSVIQQKLNLCNDIEKKHNILHQHHAPEFYSPDMKKTCSPMINNVISSSSKLSPALSRNNYGTLDSHSRSNTPIISKSLESVSNKKSKRSPNNQLNNETFSNKTLIKFSNFSMESQKCLTQMMDSGNYNSPESIRTPLSPTSLSSTTQASSEANCLYNSSSNIIQCKSFTQTNFNLINTMTSSHENNPEISQDSDMNIISSTTGHNNNLSLRNTASVNIESVNKQTSSGSSNPSSPPEFFDPHSATTTFEDDDNSSLHLQRLIGFIDEILSEEEEYVLDTQWASFTWPSADKSLDLLHLSDIEKFL